MIGYSDTGFSVVVAVEALDFAVVFQWVVGERIVDHVDGGAISTVPRGQQRCSSKHGACLGVCGGPQRGKKEKEEGGHILNVADG